MSAQGTLKDAWKNREKLGDENHTREMAAFLPAALEIQQSPSNPLAKWISRTLIALFLLGLVWACLGKVNIVASAEGKIIPSSRIKKVQPLQVSVVKNIMVKEGQYVKKNQALIELDNTLTQADEQRLVGELLSARLNLSVSQALLNLLDLKKKQQSLVNFSDLNLDVKEIVSEKETILHKRHLWQQWLQYKAQLQGLNSGLIRTKAENATTREIIIKLQKTLPIIERRALTMKNLYDKNFASEIDYLELEQERIERKQDLAAEKQRMNQLIAAEAEAVQQIHAMNAQVKAEKIAEITEIKRQIAVLNEELAKAADTHSKQILYSPVSGQVQSLAINTIGGVVTEAQELMLIVPDAEQLEVEVFLANKDIGFVRKGMSAEIKIHTFPFTKYGVIEGDIITISDDAILDEKRGLIYGMHLLMASNSILVNGRDVKLMPGMAVTAEVQTGERRIIEFFMAPLLRYKEESIRER